MNYLGSDVMEPMIVGGFWGTTIPDVIGII